MNQNIKHQILDTIGTVYVQSYKCKLTWMYIEYINYELCILSDYFNTSKIQSLFIAMVFAFNYKGDTVDFNDLIDYFDCNPMKLLEYNDDFDVLHS
ncbi:MAG: AAA family ATPase, partial [Bacteroidota bacterium]|nr:AAA family ATPase [Bacteroidota bacterium]